MIWDSLVYAYAVLAIVPIIPFIIVYIITFVRKRDRKRAIRLAMDVTNVFLIGVVAMLINGRLNTGFGLYFILLILLIGCGLIGNAQNRLKGKLDTSKIVRTVWRLSFFAMTILYILLMPFEIIYPTVFK